MRSACHINTPGPGRHYQNNSDPPSSISLSCSIELPHANLFLNRMPYTYSRQGQSVLTENHPIKNHYLISNIRKVMQNTMTRPSILRVKVIVHINQPLPAPLGNQSSRFLQYRSPGKSNGPTIWSDGLPALLAYLGEGLQTIIQAQWRL